MKSLITILAMVCLAYSSRACTSSFNCSPGQSNNSLLLLTLHITSNVGSLPPGSIANYIFDFGDGFGFYYSATDTIGAYYYNYEFPGTYNVRLATVVYNSSNVVTCADTTMQTFTVSYTPCAASFTSFVDSGRTATFTANNPGGTPGITYKWNFGDGTTGSGAVITHTFPSIGYYNITLNDSATSTCSYTNTGLFHIDTPCSYTHPLITGNVSGATMNVVNSSTTTLAGYTTSAYWSFDDGGYASGNSASHSFSTPGLHWAEMIETFTNGLTACTDTEYVTATTFSSSPNQITGRINIDSASGYNPVNPYFMVWLIKYDSVNALLYAVDSMEVIGTHYQAHYSFANKPADKYRVKAMVVNGPVTGSAALPTYGYDSLYWHGAQTINYSGSGIDSGNNIFLQDGTITTGPGFISGSISSGANKGTKTTGVPVEGMIVFLQNSSGKALAFTKTDATGYYQFSNFPAGNYKIYPENAGYATTTANVTVGASHVNYVDFTEHTISKTITPSNVGVPEVSANGAAFMIYPNPGSGLFNIVWNSSIPAPLAYITVTDIAGRKVAGAELNMNTSTGSTQLDLTRLNGGIYFVNIKGVGISYAGKIVLQ